MSMGQRAVNVLCVTESEPVRNDEPWHQTKASCPKMLHTLILKRHTYGMEYSERRAENREGKKRKGKEICIPCQQAYMRMCVSAQDVRVRVCA